MITKEEVLKKEEERLQKHTSGPINRPPGTISPTRAGTFLHQKTPTSEKIDDYRSVLKYGKSATERVIPVETHIDKPQQTDTHQDKLTVNQPAGRSTSPFGRSISWKDKREEELKKKEASEAEKKEKEKERIAAFNKSKPNLTWKELRELDEKKKRKKITTAEKKKH